MYIVLITISYYKIRSLEIRKTLSLKKAINFLLLIVIIESEASLVKLWDNHLGKVFDQTIKVNEANLIIFQSLVVMLLPLRKTKNKMIKT